jgi:6-phosphogluconolactonase (cycloisomerase 2 family)
MVSRSKHSALTKSLLAAGVLIAGSAVYGQDPYANSVRRPAVFAATNNAERNEIIAFVRNADGTLREENHFRTGGRGSGGNNDPLESQGSLTLTSDHSTLLAVNAGSGEISVFRVHAAFLELSDLVPSGGSEPNAVAQYGNLVYVLNAGGSSNVNGFRLQNGALTPIPNSLRFLTTNSSGAASLAFSPDGRFLAVTERLTNDIDVFPVNSDGTLGGMVTFTKAGAGTFSLSFAPDGTLIVSETGGPGSATSSYAVQPSGALSVISASVPSDGAANCWNAITPDGRFVYVSNAGSATIAGYAIGATGALTPLPGTVVGTNPTGATNLDIAVSGDGRFLYSLNSGNGTIGVFAIHNDGTLSPLPAAEGITANAGFNGITAE